jgi:hypothetical protein
MAENTEKLVRREFRSPRAAAIAGIVYSLLIITVMLLTTGAARARPEEVTREWLETWSGTFSLVLTMVPFAGIAFLWFTGVIRDRLREREDRFFATIFLGSGIIQVLLLFMWGAILGSLMRMKAITTLGMVDDFSPDLYIFGVVLMNEIIGNFGVRMAGVYMTAIGTLWAKTGLMPRWFTVVTYILALGFLVAAERIREARFIFPAWVLVVSVYILVLNYRRTYDQEDEDELSVDD